jgi:hypothetical protein
MAQKTIVSLVDDLDGSAADETVGFGLDGVSYEIDLTDTHAKSLRDAFADYVAHARQQGRTTRKPRTRTSGRATGSASPTGTTAVDREQNKAIRDWARTHGHTISDRGRIPAEITEAYHQAH